MTRLRSIPGGLVLVCFLAVAARAASAQDPEITDRARQLNESFDNPEAEWVARFESEGREIFDFRYAIVDQLGLMPGMDVADIGAGSGLLTRLIARRIAPAGIVYAVDIAETMIEYITETSEEMGLDNVRPVLGAARSPRLPENSADVVLVVATYHHFEYPKEMLAEIKKVLRPGGLFVLVDNERVEGVTPPGILGMVRAGKGTFTDEIKDAGFDLMEEVDIGMEEHYLLKFRHRQM